MTTHQLASLLEHLQLGFGDSLKSGTGFADTVAAIRELPDQSLKELANSLRKAHTPSGGGSRAGSSSADVPAMIEQIRAIRNGTAPGPDVPDPSRLTITQLKEILRDFQQLQTGTKGVLVTRVRQLASPADQTNTTVPAAIAPLSEPDQTAVDEGVRVYTELRDNKSLTISDVRTGFERLRGYSKPVVEEISRRFRYTPHGSRTEILNRLLSNLEGLKVSQYKMEQILTGT